MSWPARALTGETGSMAVLGLGLAALGRPGYLTVDHGAAIGPDRSVEALRQRCLQVCDAAWEGGIRWFDAARSYGRAEEFLAGWLSRRAIEPGEVTVSSKWGYTYTADWSVDAEVPEVKDHSAAALARQWPETEARLGRWLRLYQVHSATLESGILDDREVHRALAALGVPVGLSLSGPGQSEVLRRALSIDVEGRPLFSAVQATWNLLEPSVAPALVEAKAAGWTVIVKEALANGRLAVPGPTTASLGDHPDVTALAAALTRPWADVVLSGAATVSELRSNLVALGDVTGTDMDRFGEFAVDPQVYWRERAAMRWT
jgi:aryl-alcohol dehydrogenase-like predicted oxidoreductase